jgi:hypothetical protein
MWRPQASFQYPRQSRCARHSCSRHSWRRHSRSCHSRRSRHSRARQSSPPPYATATGAGAYTTGGGGAYTGSAGAWTAPGMPNPMATSTCADAAVDAASTIRPSAAPRIFLVIFAIPRTLSAMTIGAGLSVGAGNGHRCNGLARFVTRDYGCVRCSPGCAQRGSALPTSSTPAAVTSNGTCVVDG